MCRLLRNLVESYPYIMLEHVSRLKELLDYFTFMHVKVASSIVTAISPLIKLSRDLQVLVLLLFNLKKVYHFHQNTESNSFLFLRVENLRRHILGFYSDGQ